MGGHLDDEDLAALREEFRDALAVAASQQDTAVLTSMPGSWRVTAIDLAEPLSGPTLRGDYNDEDFVEAARPVREAAPKG